MDEKNLGEQKPEQDQNHNTEQDNQSMLDKVIQNNPFLKFNQGNLENVQTQSVVKSTREEANEQLAQINAYNAELARQQKLAEEAAKAKRTGIYIAIGIFFGIILIVGIWLAVNAIIAATQGGVQTGSGQEQEGPAKYGKVEGYRCKTENCEKAAEISEGNILIRDGSSFYLYEIENKKSSLTTIPEQDYHAVTPFVWGGKNYLVLDPESAQSAIFSVTDNRIVTEFAYDEFFYDVKAEQYAEMAWAEGKYIVAKSNGLYCLIQLSNGKEIIRAGKRVFVHDDYYYAYEADGTIHIYTDSTKKIYVAKANDILFTEGCYIIAIEDGGNVRIYNHDGQEDNSADIYEYISNLDNGTVVTVLDQNPSYYRIPANK
ncbi:hypothetical protein IKG13_02575 [Candidatus Saccharibacteria bacterium]|nr:hypothetical protein [Candidatus Saccharibacteria bacterium]